MKILDGLSVGGLVIGAGVVLLAPVVVPVVATMIKPMAKALIKGGILAFESARVSLAETRETLEDITAEAKAEIADRGSEA